MKEEYIDIELLSRMNIAMNDLALEFNERAVSQCLLVLEKDPTRWKAHLRIAQGIYKHCCKFKIENHPTYF